MELNELLDTTADRIVAYGTRTESWTLEAMASATRGRCPGAAAALVDWGATEIFRLRAFGIVHGVVLHELTSRERHDLRTEILGDRPLALAV